MPTSHARKAAIRAAQRPGESYTAAARRLDNETAAPEWELDGEGLGSTEYTTTINGRDLIVTFAGDHKRPWLGWWDLVDADDPSTSLASGRHRFTTARPDDDAIHAALATISGYWSQICAGASPEDVDTISAEHGPELGGSDVVDEGTYFIASPDLGPDSWFIGTLEELGDEYEPCWRIDAFGYTQNGERLTPDPAGGWVDTTGRRVHVYAL